jgi:hypothetical protein
MSSFQFFPSCFKVSLQVGEDRERALNSFPVASATVSVPTSDAPLQRRSFSLSILSQLPLKCEIIIEELR